MRVHLHEFPNGVDDRIDVSLRHGLAHDDVAIGAPKVQILLGQYVHLVISPWQVAQVQNRLGLLDNIRATRKIAHKTP